MKVQNFAHPTPVLNRALPRAAAAEVKPAETTTVETVELGNERSVAGSALKSALVGAAYGAAIGAGTSYLYGATDLGTATLAHMGGILGGGALGAGVLGKVMQPKIEAPASYALGALAGAGVTWATSALGMLQNPVVGVVAGSALGAFFGAVGGAIHASGNNNGGAAAQKSAPAEQAGEGQHLPKGAWKALAVAYGVGGTAITGGMVALAATGHLTAGAALAGGLVATGAFANAYMLSKS